MYEKKPDVSYLRIFGAKAFVRIPDSMRRKVDPKKTIFVGYDRFTDKIDLPIFDPIKKSWRESDVIQDVEDANNSVLFSLSPDEQEQDFEESLSKHQSQGISRPKRT